MDSGEIRNKILGRILGIIGSGLLFAHVHEVYNDTRIRMNKMTS